MPRERDGVGPSLAPPSAGALIIRGDVPWRGLLPSYPFGVYFHVDPDRIRIVAVQRVGRTGDACWIGRREDPG